VDKSIFSSVCPFLFSLKTVPNSEHIGLALRVPESLIYVMAMDKEDVPPEKALIYETLFPVIQNMVLQIASK